MATEHAHAHNVTGRKLAQAFGLTIIILLVELGGGWVSDSLALLSDAGHVLTDVIALGLAWFATAQAARPPNASRTFGYHRIGILTALLNAITLILIVGGIAVEAVGRFRHPEPVDPLVMFGSALVGIVVNLYIGFGLRAESGENLNVRAAMLHVFGDVGASIGVVLAGVVILLTGWELADPLISIAIAVLIAKGGWDILRETVDILMEATPKTLNIAELVRDLLRVPGVTDVHDLHVWSIAGGMPILPAHVQVAEDRPLSRCDTLRTQIDDVLQSRYKIAHSTLQMERTCAATDLYCNMQAGEPDAEQGPHDHDHPPGVWGRPMRLTAWMLPVRRTTRGGER